MQSYTYHVQGMHCASCVALTESELADLPEVRSVKASLERTQVVVTGEFGTISAEALAERLNVVMQPHGYTLSLEKQAAPVKWEEFRIAVPVAAAFVLGFIALQRMGIVDLVSVREVSYGAAFVIGLVASVSTCMAVVGGLVLSVSANFAKVGDAVKPQILFHVGRFVSFFVLGGLIGVLGSFFQLSGVATAVMSIALAVVLVVLGLNLLDVFAWAKRFQVSFPSFMGKHVRGMRTVNHRLMPVVIGAATFVLPCGFTQSMQLYSLSSGSFWTGALTMTAFAAGTFPVLALLSFGSLGLKDSKYAGTFYKAAGLVVIFFGVLTLSGALRVLSL